MSCSSPLGLFSGIGSTYPKNTRFARYKRNTCNAVSSEASRILQPQEYKARISRMWEGRGASYDQSDTFHEALALQLVSRARLVPGEDVLDVATGTGMVAIPAGQLIGKTGRLTGIDISESMLAEARKKAQALQLPHCEFHQADFEAADFEDGSFNVALCSSGMLYLQDIPSSIRRLHRCLKPQGRLCFNTPQEPCVPATKVFYTLLEQIKGIKLADAAAPLATAEIAKAVCLECGFKHVMAEKTSEKIVFPNCQPEDYAERIWKSVASNAMMTPLDDLLSLEALERDVKALYIKQVTELARPWLVNGGIENPYTMLWVTAFKGEHLPSQ